MKPSLWPRASTRPRSGLTPHLLVPADKKSGCPEPAHHGLCAFDGTEPDRCPLCHRGLHEGPCALKETSEFECAACGVMLATVTDFARHQITYPDGHPLEGVFTGRCHDPADIGLELAGGVWGTPEGNAKRARLAENMAAISARKRRR